ncbi:MAG: DUF418 domain-containing protein [Bacteroidetes bacterium]|uniref:DUF418 domain-containing protein n=1 Tax=Candidatus Cryptobacteroides merdavium TaxID=2840769 RepID=A0A9D9EE76_9BACT|nr:DUF418 domain-containing protein [Candidatus Cryptobacteroides merdavium]
MCRKRSDAEKNAVSQQTAIRLSGQGNETGAAQAAPVKASERHRILDVLRGFALLGICLANYPEFSLYTFQSAETVAAMPSAGIDRVLRWLLYFFVDGKFYTLFSLLFGIGFSIIISNAAKKGQNGFRIFYRRMALLVLIGFLHLMFIWSGDILMLYALVGMILPLFRNVSGRGLLAAAAFFLVLPVAVDTVTAAAGVPLSAPAVKAQWHFCDRYGITEENFGVWLRDADSYREVLQFLVQGAMVRIQELVDGNRYFKVLGLFLTGFWMGRNRLYACLEDRKPLLRKAAGLCFIIGLPFSFVYAWSCMEGHPFGNVAHSVLYLVSVYPMGFAYMAGLSLLYLRFREGGLWKWLAAPGRMALSNYIGQSLLGMFIFYGIGLGFGASAGLSATLLTAMSVYVFQMAFSRFWMHFFNFGPLEWIWRMLTYGRRFCLMKSGR